MLKSFTPKAFFLYTVFPCGEKSLDFTAFMLYFNPLYFFYVKLEDYIRRNAISASQFFSIYMQKEL